MLLRFLNLPHHQKRLLFQAFISLLVIQGLLWFLPFRRLLSLVEKQKRLNVSAYSPEQIARAVQLIAHYLPFATCLPQALTAQLLLGRQGYAASLRIGVNKAADSLKGHAWLEYGGQVILGGEIKDYQVFPELKL